MTFSVENGCFAYGKNSPQILKSISFEVHSGELMAILGPNGAGKTTLLRCALGFLRWTSGASKLDGVRVSQIPQSEFWRRVAYVPQARGVSSSNTALEMTLLGCGGRLGIFEQPSEQDIAAAEAILERLKIGQLAGKRCSEVSGGELQMILIARALAARPQVLILDEPESNLDFRNQLLIMNTLSELASEGIACIFNTHYPSHALQRADKALLLDRNGAYRFGSTADVVTEQSIEQAFGVHAVIAEIQTPDGILRDVIPSALSEEGDEGTHN